MSGSTKAPPNTKGITSPQGLALEHALEHALIQDTPAPVERSALDALIDRLAGDVILRYATGQRTLDLGHGSAQISDWVAQRARELRIINSTDLGHDATVCLPVADASVDVVYSMRTLPHLGHDEPSSELAVRAALAEIHRVLVPGGAALCQIDNPRSLWGLYHGIRHPVTLLYGSAIIQDAGHYLTRLDTLGRFLHWVPAELSMADVHGLGVVTPLADLLRVPILAPALARMEWWARDRAPLRYFGSRLLVVLQRMDHPH